MDQDGHHHHFDLSLIIIVLFGIMAGSLLVAAYQCIVAHSCRAAGTISSPDRNGARSLVPPRQQNLVHEPTSHVVGSTCSVAVQPASTYLKLRIIEFKDGKCAVCLSEFNSGEEIRVLPECGHAFHMVCVDMWLFSHSNCPLCRARTDTAQHVIVVPLQSSSSSSGSSSPSEPQTQITGSQET